MIKFINIKYAVLKDVADNAKCKIASLIISLSKNNKLQNNI